MEYRKKHRIERGRARKRGRVCRRLVSAVLAVMLISFSFGGNGLVSEIFAAEEDVTEESFVTDALTEDYIRDHADPQYVSADENLKIVNAIYIKQSLFDGSLVDESDTLDSIMGGIDQGETEQYMKFVTNLSGVAAVYDADAESDYYVAYANTMQQDKDTSVRDWVFAAYNENGMVLEDCIFDPDTGLAYLSKELFTDEIMTVQVQFMQVLGVEASDAESVIESDVYNTVNNLIDAETTVQAEAGLDPDNLVVAVNGVPMDSDFYQYNAETGVLSIAQPAAGIGTVSVTEQTESARAALAKVFGPVTAKAAVVWEDMIVYKTTPAEMPAWVSEGTVFIGDAYLDYVDGQIHTEADGHYGYSSSSLDDLVDVINGNEALDWDKIRLRTSEDGMIDFKLSLNNNRLYADEDASKDGKWMGVWGTFTLECVHTSTDLGYDADADGDYTGAMVRFFKIDKAAGYAFIGLNTVKTQGQTGAGLFKVAIHAVSEGKIRIEKTSAEPDVTDGNANYSIGGAVYTVKAAEDVGDYSSGDTVATLTVDAGGVAETEKIPLGHYTVQETAAPDSYVLDETIYDVMLADDGSEEIIQVVESAEKPQKGYVELNKKSGFPDLTDGNRSYSLQGAEYSIVASEPIGTKYSSGDVVEILVTDEDGYAKSGELPLGEYSIRETRASAGYQLDVTEYNVSVTAGETSTVSSVEKPYYSFGLDLIKVDLDTDSTVPEGDASLAGAQFTVKYYDTTGYQSVSELVKAEKPLKTWVMETKEQRGAGGKVQYELDLTDAYKVSGDTLIKDDDGKVVLPLGTLTIEETKAPEGYLIDNSFIQPCDQNGKPSGTKTTGVFMTTITPGTDRAVIAAGNHYLCSEQVIRGGFSIKKRDADTLSVFPQGAASLTGAVFEVINKSKLAVLVNGKIYQPDERIIQLGTDENAGAGLDLSFLPYGTYQVKETQAPEGYLLSGDLEETFEIRQDGTIVDLTDPEHAITNKVMRGDFRLRKIGSSTQDRLGYVTFSITSDTTGETHTFTTDIMGNYSSAKIRHSVNTNQGGVKDGLWFGQYTDQNGKINSLEPNDEDGALPYDTYTIRELYIKDRAGNDITGNRQLLTLKLYVNDETMMISEDQKFVVDGMIDMGNVENTEISISTTAKGAETDAHEAVASEETEITDTVMMTGLMVTETYTIKGTLMDRETGEAVLDAEGNPVRAEDLTFTALSGVMTKEMTYSFDASSLGGHDIVAFEELYDSNGELVAKHEDLNDEDQTIHFPKIGTKASDADTGGNLSEADEEVTLIDTVSYHNLTSGRRYTVTGTLMDQETGEVLYDANGKEITARTSFRPEAESGEIQVTFRFDGTSLSGKTAVVFENLYRNDRLVAVHADVEDEAQTIRFPGIGTTAVDAADGDHIIKSEEHVKVTDTVAYENLIPGETYRLKGTLMDRESGEEVRNGENAITADVQFTAEESAGTVEAEFTFDASERGGHTFVVFEKLYLDKEEIAHHEDIDDEGQTITIEMPEQPSVETPTEKPVNKQTITQTKTTIIEKESAPTNTIAAPETGDDIHIIRWIVICICGVCCLAGGILYRRTQTD